MDKELDKEIIDEAHRIIKEGKEKGEHIQEDGTVICKALLFKLMEVDNRLKKLEARGSKPLIH